MLRSAFVVRKRVGHEYNRDAIPDPRDQYLTTFDDRVAAERHARALDLEHVRANLPIYVGGDRSPFDQGLAAATSMPEHVFRDWLLDAGIEPPAPAGPYKPYPRRKGVSDVEWAEEVRRAAEWHATEPWVQWWETVVAAGLLMPAELARVWEGLNRYQFHEVVEVDAPARAREPAPPPGGTVYAVVHSAWEYDDCWYCGSNEALAVFRTRKAAEAERDRRKAELGATGEFWNGGPNELVVVELPVAAEG